MISLLIYTCLLFVTLIIISTWQSAADKKYLKEFSKEMDRLQDKNKELKKRIRRYEILEYPLCFTCTTKSCQYNQAYEAKEVTNILKLIYQECEQAKRCVPCDKQFFTISNLAKRALEKI